MTRNVSNANLSLPRGLSTALMASSQLSSAKTSELKNDDSISSNQAFAGKQTTVLRNVEKQMSRRFKRFTRRREKESAGSCEPCSSRDASNQTQPHFCLSSWVTHPFRCLPVSSRRRRGTLRAARSRKESRDTCSPAHAPPNRKAEEIVL